MKKNIFIIMLGVGTLSQAQSIDLTVGYSPNGFGTEFSYNKYFDSSESYLQLGLNASYPTTEYKENKIPYSDIVLQLAYYIPFYENNKQTITTSGAVGLLAGYEIANMDKSLPNGIFVSSESNFIYGGYVSGEMSIFLFNNLFALLKYNQYYHINSDLGTLSLYGGVGVRYFIN